jgi:antitoxin MazE
MKIAKWGNSLAVRLPAKLVSELGLKEGDDIQLTASGDRQLDVSLEDSREQRIARMRELRVPWPEGYVFNREEANARGEREPQYPGEKADNKGAAAD